MKVAMPFYEFEEFKRSVNRKIWIMVLGLLLVTLAALLLVGFLLVRPVPVVVFDSSGRPILIEDTVTPRLELDAVRVEYFTEWVLERWVAVNSLTVERDSEEVVMAMTEDLQKIVINTPEEIERRARYADANVSSQLINLQIRIGDYDTRAEYAKVHVVAWGELFFEPTVGNAPEGPVSQWFLSQMILQRVPITKQTISGLLLDYVHTSLFETQEELQVHVLKKRR